MRIIHDLIQEFKRRLNWGNACCYSMENRFSSRLQSNNIRINIHLSFCMPVELGLSAYKNTREYTYENKVRRKIYELKIEEITEG